MIRAKEWEHGSRMDSKPQLPYHGPTTGPPELGVVGERPCRAGALVNGPRWFESSEVPRK